MKDIKIFLIGFLTCACLFLIMGHQIRYMSAEDIVYNKLNRGTLDVEQTDVSSMITELRYDIISLRDFKREIEHELYMHNHDDEYASPLHSH